MGYFKPLTGTWLASVLTALIFGATVFGSGAVVLLSTTTECGAGEGGLWGGGGGIPGRPAMAKQFDKKKKATSTTRKRKVRKKNATKRRATKKGKKKDKKKDKKKRIAKKKEPVCDKECQRENRIVARKVMLILQAACGDKPVIDCLIDSLSNAPDRYAEDEHLEERVEKIRQEQLTE